jgi:hemolysin D
MKLAENVIRFRRALRARTNDELAFLPAALEILETPPSPVGQVLAYMVIAIFCIGLGWATFGTVDIVAVAPGKIIPSGRTKVIQPFETGVLRAINVHDGQSVKIGDTLVELDPTMAGAELGHLKSDLMAARLEAARLRAAIVGNTDPTIDFQPPEGATPDAVEMHRRLLASQTAEQQAKIQEIKRQETQKEAERETIGATINKLGETIPLLQERVNIRKHLTERELGSKLLYLTDLQELVGQQQDRLLISA